MNPQPHNWVARLRRFVAHATAPESCELCSAAISAEHAHLVEPSSRRLLCACDACAILLASRADGRYRRVPAQPRVLADFQMTDAQWDSLAVPIGMAFFYYSTPDARIIAQYPSPAGATESLLSLDAWSGLVAANPVLDAFEPDTEALLVNRIDGACEYYRAPIDRCYALVGLIRKSWRGISGGAEARGAIGEFFAAMRERAIGSGNGAHA